MQPTAFNIKVSVFSTHTHSIFNVLCVVLTARNNYFSTSLSRLIIKILKVQKKENPEETITFNAIDLRFGAIIAVNMKSVCIGTKECVMSCSVVNR